MDIDLRQAHRKSKALIQRNEFNCHWDNLNIGTLCGERLSVLERMIDCLKGRMG
ncbi:TPA: hypothetical protein SAN82_000330 [Pseudomonas putida]|nr:hypothetical protein [Pseudomonas putida]